MSLGFPKVLAWVHIEARAGGSRLRPAIGFRVRGLQGLLGGSWVVISGVISRVTIVITQIRGLIAPLTTTHEPPSGVQGLQSSGFRACEVSGSGSRASGSILIKLHTSLIIRLLTPLVSMDSQGPELPGQPELQGFCLSHSGFAPRLSNRSTIPHCSTTRLAGSRTTDFCQLPTTKTAMLLIRQPLRWKLPSDMQRRYSAQPVDRITFSSCPLKPHHLVSLFSLTLSVYPRVLEKVSSPLSSSHITGLWPYKVMKLSITILL